MKKILALSFALLFLGAGCAQKNPFVPDNNADANLNFNSSSTNANQKSMKTWPTPTVLPKSELKNKQAVIETGKGKIIFEIYPDDAPLAASNFITLAKGGFYDGVTFHRVVPGFVIQGGDPAGTGEGGPGYHFEIEPVKRAYEPGTVAMARTMLPDSNGSQFFIVLPGGENKLAPEYTIFGKVTQGMDVVSSISIGDVMEKVTIEEAK